MVSRPQGGDSVNKAQYVKNQGQTRPHTCHWPGCDQQVPPAMWGCRKHWFTLPKPIRDRIWATYQPGQEVSMTPSQAYIEAAEAAQQWIKNRLMSRDTEARELSARLDQAQQSDPGRVNGR